MARNKSNGTVDLVEESHKAVTEIAAARERFAAGKIGSDQASAHIGFNATAQCAKHSNSCRTMEATAEKRSRDSLLSR